MKKSTIIKIGISFTITFFLFVWGISYLKGKKLLSRNKVLYAVYDRVDGLTNASPVMVNGFVVGQIQDMYFAKDGSGKLIVEIFINDKYPIQQNSVAEITSLDLMGSKGIEIHLDLSSKDIYHHGDTMVSSIEEGLQAQITPIKEKAEKLISSLDSVLLILHNVFNQETQKNLILSFASIQNTINNLQSTSYTLNGMMSSEKDKFTKIFTNVESITTNFKNNNDMLNKIISNFGNISDSLAKADLAKTIITANSSLTQLNSMLDKINNGKGTISQLLKNDTLYTNIENATSNLNKLIIDINENPKRYIHFSVIELGKTKFSKK